MRKSLESLAPTPPIIQDVPSGNTALSVLEQITDNAVRGSQDGNGETLVGMRSLARNILFAVMLQEIIIDDGDPTRVDGVLQQLGVPKLESSNISTPAASPQLIQNQNLK